MVTPAWKVVLGSLTLGAVAACICEIFLSLGSCGLHLSPLIPDPTDVSVHSHLIVGLFGLRLLAFYLVTTSLDLEALSLEPVL